MLPTRVTTLFCLISCYSCQKTWPEPVLKNQHKSVGTKLSRAIPLFLRGKPGNTMGNRKYMLLEITNNKFPKKCLRKKRKQQQQQCILCEDTE